MGRIDTKGVRRPLTVASAVHHPHIAMSSDNQGNTSNTSKGKTRATQQDLDERTPLLASGSGTHYDLEPGPPRRRRLFTKLLSVFVFFFSVCILLFILVLLIAYSYGSRASDISSDELIQRALVVRGPDRLDVLNITREGGIWVNVQGRVGLDAGSVIGVASGEDDSIFIDWWKSMGRWGIHQLDRVTVNLTTIDVSSQHDHLATISLPLLELSLTADPPENDSWLTKVSIPVYVQPTKNISALARFVRESWRDGTVRIEAHVGSADIRGGRANEDGWRTRLRAIRSDVHSKVSLNSELVAVSVCEFPDAVNVSVPRLPGLPPPGSGRSLPPASELVTLQSFRIKSEDSRLAIQANATAVNPVPENVHYTMDPIPFSVSLPTVNNSQKLIPIASISTAPFSLTHPNITLALSGRVEHINMNASATVSAFLANYVSARDSKVAISTPLIPGFFVNTTFPALRPKPQILRDVTIRNMKIKTSSGGGMLASGTVYAQVVLPPGFHVNLNVSRILPDVLIFDGEVPDEGVSSPPAPPLPDPLPERAFGHIRPDDWVPSTSMPVPSEEGEGTAVEVFAQIVDVPLEVLPGRDREFRNFVGKVSAHWLFLEAGDSLALQVIFSSDGAVAGVKGVAAVAVSVEGLRLDHGDMELDGLPFKGMVRIGKDTLLFPLS